MKKYPNFISFEGIDFCGKTTQIEILLKKLSENGIDAEMIREPGGTIISEKIRTIILDKNHSEMVSQAEILLYSAARTQMVHQTVLPKLDAGKFIIADRFFDSTTAYQGAGRGLDLTFVAQLNAFATSGLIPYKTFFIDISPKEAVDRRQKAGRDRDRLESESIAFYDKIYQAYLQLVAKNPERFIVIPGNATIDAVAAVVWQEMQAVWLDG